MKRRRRFSGDLKAKVALEALRGDRTLQEIASKHQVHPNQVSDLPPGTSPPSKLDPEPFEVHPRG